MTWAALLLADPSPLLRRHVLRELLGRPDRDPEVRELIELRSTDPLARDVFDRQQPDGSWRQIDAAYAGGTLLATARALARLGYLGIGVEHPTVRQGAEYLFSQQRKNGSWSLPREKDGAEAGEGYSMWWRCCCSG